jgi:radical SAM superfamily enzyme with C-terminal helix-hairpin-helix motif
MNYTILDCYTDEAAGLGVPPYIGTYPRYIAGEQILQGNNVNYITIDDLRYLKIYNNIKKETPKTNIKIYNLTRKDCSEILKKTDILIIICGVQVPGKYLSALPGTLYEVQKLIQDLKCKKILTGPAATEFGTRLEGGKKAEKITLELFDEIIEVEKDYSKIAKYSIAGAKIVNQAPFSIIAEIETARGCQKGIACSFCTEPLKNKLEFRKIDDIINEIKALRKEGIINFRLGKQSDFFAWKTTEIEEMLSRINIIKGIKTLHIDNIDPARVTEEKVKLVVKYCSPSNIAALGVETFDENLTKENNLNSKPSISMKAIKIINKYGNKIGKNGMPYFLPGLNILFGLKGENKKTHKANMTYMHELLDENLLVRRINIRQVAIFPGTQLHEECGDKFVKKNKKYYWKWRNEIRQKIDNPMLQKLVPIRTILKDVRMEIYDGNTTFGRQIGTYPLIIGIKERLELGKFYNIEVIGHMLRSIVGKVL